MKKVISFIVIFVVCCIPQRTMSWGTDPVRVAAIEITKGRQKKVLEAELAAQALNAAGHLWIKEEQDAINDYLKEFNCYLGTFHDVLTIAAETFGIYYEVKNIAKNLSSIEKVIAERPENVMATAFSANKNKVYTSVVKASIDVIMDVKKVCFDEAKMTQQERLKTVDGIRPKLRKLNMSLRNLALTIHYTSFLDVWNEIAGRAFVKPQKSKHELILKSRQEWWNRAKTVSARR